MDIDEQFNVIAKEYDINRKRFIPCFEDYYESTTKFLTSNIKAPKRVLDLGAGTGLLTSFWYKYFPESEYVLVDIADKMLEVAIERFSGLENVSYQVLDYAKELPDEAFEIIISALSIHHLENTDKAELFQRIYDKLPTGGIFVNYDQFCGETVEMSTWFNSYWEKQLSQSGLSELDLERWMERRKFDKECSVKDEMAMLQKFNFRNVENVYTSQKFAVIVAIK